MIQNMGCTGDTVLVKNEKTESMNPDDVHTLF